MTGDWLYEMNLGVIFLGTLIFFTISLAIGIWLGNRNRKGDGPDSQVNTIQAAILGLLGLLLAFTFSMAADRYSTRRKMVVDEANAIGTTYLRADFLPEPVQTEIKDLLAEYVDARLAFYDAGIDPIKLEQAVKKTLQLQEQIWQKASVVSVNDPRSITNGLVIQSLNEMIDLHAVRMAAMNNRVPEVIIDLIFIVAILTLGLIGYGIGVSKQRNLVPTLMTLFLIASIFVVIIDLDRPRRGLIKVSQESMIQLHESLK